MQSMNEAQQRSYSAALSIVPILILTFAVIGTMSFLARMSYDTNQSQAHQLEVRRIELALANETHQFAERFNREVVLYKSALGSRPFDLQSFSDHISRSQPVDFIAIFDAKGKILSVVSPNNTTLDKRMSMAVELIRERPVTTLPNFPRNVTTSKTMLESNEAVGMAAVDFDLGIQIVASLVMGEEVLARIGSNLLLNDLRFKESDEPGSKLSSQTHSTVVWNRITDGSITLDSLASIGFLGISVIGIYGLLVYMHIRRVTRDLAHSEAEAQHMAGHDALSGLPNRVLFSKRLDQELDRINREDGGIAVMFLDLDKFKDVNDTLGHAVGDKLIIAVSRRLGELVRGADTIARFGGDEFAVIQIGVRSADDSEALARRILEDIRRPYILDGAEVEIGVSIGISVAPENAKDAPTLMRYADVALYRAKNEGRNRYSFFDKEMNDALRMKKLVEDELRNAIDTNQLELDYQPIMTPDGERIVGLEALVRWRHAEMGLISPVQFIGIAEERGLIAPLGEWVLRHACQFARQFENLIIAVNISPVQFKQKDFVSNVARILRETGLDSNRLELELTEGIVIDDAEMAENAIIELRAMGIRVALDDFGTGYSSLIYLRRFAFDKIKIDKSFLQSMEATGESSILVHSIVHLGRALGLEVTAEGVETEEQHRFLQAVGCHYLQGFLFSKPVSEVEIRRKLNMQAATMAAIRAAA